MNFNFCHRHRWIVCTALIIVMGCSDSHSSHNKEKAALSRMLYSPNGEPLNGGSLGRPTCRDGLSRWFDRIDANHNGSISRDEFLADAQIQFRRMDIDNNGYLVPEELERFRRPYRQTGNEETPAATGGNAAPAQQNGHRHGGPKKEHSDTDSSQIDEADVDTSDPVMSADTNLDNKVTPEEFMLYARKKFSELDTNQDGTLSREEVSAPCTPKQ